jgi:hypothetical protein
MRLKTLEKLEIVEKCLFSLILLLKKYSITNYYWDDCLHRIDCFNVIDMLGISEKFGLIFFETFLSIFVYFCLFLSIFVYFCLFLSIFVYFCLFLSIFVYFCLILSILVNSCLFLFCLFVNSTKCNCICPPGLILPYFFGQS